tara:strand:+ start:2617 stop:3069 length:453 start_codon:yes stop_codon:yes gene_type:complete
MGYLRKAKLKDLDYVVKNLRVMDKIEVFYQTGQKPENAIRLSYLYTKENMAIADDDDNPIGLCGVVSDGCIWMVATDDLFVNKKYRIQLIRQGKQWVDSLLKKYNLLYNMVYAENDSAIKWLRCLGFTFINYHAEYGEHSKPFYEFMRIA